MGSPMDYRIERLRKEAIEYSRRCARLRHEMDYEARRDVPRFWIQILVIIATAVCGYGVNEYCKVFHPAWWLENQWVCVATLAIFFAGILFSFWLPRLLVPYRYPPDRE